MQKGFEEIFIKIGKNISSQRLERGFTQNQIAEKVGITQSLYAYYEKGRRRIPVPVLLKISDVLNIYVDDLLPIDADKKKRGPIPKIDRELAKVKVLPEKQQRLVLDLIETIIRNNPKAS